MIPPKLLVKLLARSIRIFSMKLSAREEGHDRAVLQKFATDPRVRSAREILSEASPLEQAGFHFSLLTRAALFRDNEQQTRTWWSISGRHEAHEEEYDRSWTMGARSRPLRAGRRKQSSCSEWEDSVASADRDLNFL